MARDREQQLLAEAALAASAYAPTSPDWPVCGFLACAGWAYDRSLMVFGRAPNGWGQGWQPEELGSPAGAAAFAVDVLDGVEQPSGDSGPMGWVAARWGDERHYNTARSAFWRVTRHVHRNLSGHPEDAPDWSDRLVWSNLYKLAPAGGGNPSETLCRLQFASCLQLFQEELSRLWPRRVLLLTGLDWARPFLEATSEVTHATGAIEATGVYTHSDGSVTQLVVAPHPQGRSEDALAEEIGSAFDSF
jgi:hypothetical protein